VLLQLAGTVANAVLLSATCWTGRDSAVSPAIFTSARCTEPHMKPLKNCAHSPAGFPPGPVTAGNASAGSSTPGEMMRTPYDPVSTSMWSMVWQVDVPGRHRVTLTKGTLMMPLTPGGPLSITIRAALRSRLVTPSATDALALPPAPVQRRL